ncbi:MAG: hypothetical protein Q8Q15_02010 [bacterium]|nr:hypothetical protein [bacterium]
MQRSLFFLFFLFFLSLFFPTKVLANPCTVQMYPPPEGSADTTFNALVTLTKGKEYNILLTNEKGGVLLNFNRKVRIDPAAASDQVGIMVVPSQGTGTVYNTLEGFITLDSPSLVPFMGERCHADQSIKITGKPPGDDTARNVRGNCNEGNVDTALGCVPISNTNSFIAWLLKFAIGIGGGIAFILMLAGAFQIITSGGDPEKLKAGKELITSALMGLIMIIFSLFLLRLIGVQILQIPGFG